MDAIPLHRHATLRAAGFTDRELRSALRGGRLTAVRRGVYRPGDDPLDAPMDAVTQHRLLVLATLPELSGDAVVSHASAAVLHGLPDWSLPLRRVQVTKPRSYGGRRRPHLHVRVAQLAPDEVVWVEGVLLTSVARTVVDLAPCRSFESAVVLGDAALAAGLTTVDELVEMVRRSTRRPGAARARRAVSFRDGRAESVGESRSRVVIARSGLPEPQPQWEVRDTSGRLVGRADFGWPGARVVGEFDGRVKYGRLLRPGEDPGDAVYREKLREDAIRAQGHTVVRWTWDALAAFTPTAERLRSVLT